MKPDTGEFDLDLIQDLPAFLQPGDLSLRNLPLLQPLSGSIQQRLGFVRPASGSAWGDLPQEFPDNQVVLLGRHQLRAVDGEERLALSQNLVRLVGVYLPDPAGEANLDVGKPGFVRFDVSDSADLVLDLPILHDAGLHPNALHPLRT